MRILFLLSCTISSLPVYPSYSPPFFFARPGETRQLCGFPKTEMDFIHSEHRIKFKWKLDGIPGEETGLWGFEWLSVYRRGMKEISAVYMTTENRVCFREVSTYLSQTCRCDIRQASCCSPTHTLLCTARVDLFLSVLCLVSLRKISASFARSKKLILSCYRLQ